MGMAVIVGLVDMGNLWIFLIGKHEKAFKIFIVGFHNTNIFQLIRLALLLLITYCKFVTIGVLRVYLHKLAS